MEIVLFNTVELKKSEEALKKSEERYRNIFHSTMVSLLEEDILKVRAAIEKLKKQGVKDFRNYFDKHPDFVVKAVKMIAILDVNEATLHLYGARHKEELLGSLDRIFNLEALRHDADDYLMKPCEPGEIHLRVKRCLEKLE